ncbi:MAG: 4-(cytidine 5'-diphospho)-2-C-methyl-D-erythritol kinase [Clostridia bacterium]|nr:4-(cytidine 5'-diphospho)-2-C-methyl-D-erythritol kinase [Clostridia bacterium]
MKYFAPAKINLSLEIVKRLENGYHELCMIMQTVSVFDEIDIEKDDKISVFCDKDFVLHNEENTVFKAAKEFFEFTKKDGGCKISIKKNIPVGAGMGGGSSDAAEVLIALNNIYKTNLSKEILCEIAVKIGADVPFFIEKGCCIAKGIGEKLTSVKNLLEPYIVIYKPDFSISTAEAYKNFDFSKKGENKISKVTEALLTGNIDLFKKYAFNDFESSLGEKYLKIEKIKNMLKNDGAYSALMTGSGSAVFGFFSEKSKAEQCFKKYDSDKVFLAKFI